MRESKFQTTIISYFLNDLDVPHRSLNLHGHAMQGAGWPDLYIVGPVWSGWLELKIGRNKTTPLQAKRLRDIWDSTGRDGVLQRNAWVLTWDKTKMWLTPYPYLTKDNRSPPRMEVSGGLIEPLCRLRDQEGTDG